MEHPTAQEDFSISWMVKNAVEPTRNDASHPVCSTSTGVQEALSIAS
jgi:hypothetical protein